MKTNVFRMLRSGISLLLALCMVVGMCPVQAFAAESADEKETINYVSIGDSMANGYGFVGYEQDSDDRNEYDFMTGKGMYGLGAYPLQFEEYLTEQGYDVNHTKLATSAMLADDLLWLLDGRPEIDDDHRRTFSITHDRGNTIYDTVRTNLLWIWKLNTKSCFKICSDNNWFNI